MRSSHDSTRASVVATLLSLAWMVSPGLAAAQVGGVLDKDIAPNPPAAAPPPASPPPDAPAPAPAPAPSPAPAPAAPAPAPSPAPAPVPAPAPSGTTLAETGVTIQVPSGWTYGQITTDSGQKRDVLKRDAASRPTLAILSARIRGNAGCSKWEEVQRNDSNTTVIDRPVFIPSSWYHKAGVSFAGGNLLLDTCYDTPDGILYVSVLYAGTADAIKGGDMNDVQPVLFSIGQAASGGSAASPSSSSSSSGSSSDDGESEEGIWAELYGYRLAPNDDALDPIFGGMLRIHVPAPVDEGVFLAGEIGAGVGFDSKQNIPFDGYLAFGPGVGLGPVAIMPMLGVGLDSMGGGDAADYHFPAAWYYYAKGALAISGLGPVGLHASAARLWRGSIAGEGNSHSAGETRIDGGVSFSRYSIGARYVAHETSKQIGATVAVGF